MGKYDNLERFLKNNNQVQIVLSFTEIEKIINDTLPDSAINHSEPWWANDKTHSQAKAWLNAGYETDYVTDTYKEKKNSICKKKLK